MRAAIDPSSLGMLRELLGKERKEMRVFIYLKAAHGPFGHANSQHGFSPMPRHHGVISDSVVRKVPAEYEMRVKNVTY